MQLHRRSPVADDAAQPSPDIDPQSARRAERQPASRARATTWVAVAGAVLIAGSALFAGGFTLGRQTALTDGTPQALAADLQPFWDAFNSIEQRYAGVPVSRRAVIEGAIGGMFKALGDPFSMYMTGEAYRASLTGLSGQFEGIGAVITTVDDHGSQGCSPAGTTCHVAVSSLIPGAPAERAGLRPADVMLSVDGTSVAGKTIDQVVTLVRGPAGTAVTLRVQRGDAPPFDVRIVRAVINSVDVTSRVIANGTLGYIRISAFGSGVAADFTTQLHTLLADHVRGLVLDLRDDPGGFVDQARTIASQFIGGGPIYWEEIAGGSRRPIDAEPGGIATSGNPPMIVLVNKGTASASEILAGALQETGRARLLGTTTYGKGTVQEWQQLGQDMGGFRLTIARWLTPSKQWINGKGLTPNVAYHAPTTAAIGSDPELDRAIQLLTTDSAPSTDVRGTDGDRATAGPGAASKSSPAGSGAPPPPVVTGSVPSRGPGGTVQVSLRPGAGALL